MRAYSMDLRERVLHDSDAGMKAATVAVKCHVSASWVRRLKQRRRETGEVAPRRQRYGRQPPRPSTRPTSSFSMKAGSPPTCSGAMGAAPAASGSPITHPRAGERAAPSSPRCG